MIMPLRFSIMPTGYRSRLLANRCRPKDSRSGDASPRSCASPYGFPGYRSVVHAAPSSDRDGSGRRPGAERLGDTSAPAAPRHAVASVSSALSKRVFQGTLSGIASARRRLSCAFSSSICVSRLASDSSIPPYLAFSFWNVARLNPSFRRRSDVGKPASRSLILPIIYASVKWFFLMLSAQSLVGQTLDHSEGTSRAQVFSFRRVTRATEWARPTILLRHLDFVDTEAQRGERGAIIRKLKPIAR